jgi:hypothetical protein
MIRMHMNGDGNQEIADATGYTAQQVCNILGSTKAREIIDAINADSIDTAAQVQSQAQACAPLVMEKLLEDALTSPDARVRLNAKIAWLGIAGHSANRITVDRGKTVSNDLTSKTDEQIRQEILGSVPKPGVGPDGNLLQ